MEKLTVCDTKELCDTEFEAKVLASKAGSKYMVEFEPYRCGSHWHITHTDVTKRRGAGKKFWMCPRCKRIERKADAPKHKCDRMKP